MQNTADPYDTTTELSPINTGVLSWYLCKWFKYQVSGFQFKKITWASPCLYLIVKYDAIGCAARLLNMVSTEDEFLLELCIFIQIMDFKSLETFWQLYIHTVL